MFERFSEEAHRVVAVAEAEARQLGHGHLGTEHLLLGLLADGTSPAARALRDQGATLEGCREKVAEAVGPDGVAGPAADTRAQLPLTDRAKRALERASRLALRRRETLVQPGHVLISVLDVEGTAGQVLRRLNVDLAGVQHQLDHPPGPASGPVKAKGATSAATTAKRRRAAARPPRCGLCGGALDATLAHRVMRSTGDDGADRDLVVAYCGECGSVLGITSA